jgi:predicted component of viral defense system (DUF524 family)
MELLSSGASITVWDEELQSWIPFEEVYLKEAKSYRWRCLTDEPFQFWMQQIPLPMTKVAKGWEGFFETPFQSGAINFRVNEETIESHVYTDSRKLTEQQYKLLLDEILQEAKICFAQSGLELSVLSSGFKREYSMLQWNYIESSICKLQKVFRQIEAHPQRFLKKEEIIQKRESVKHITPRTVAWMERFGETFGATPDKLPSHIQSFKVKETFDVYENRVILLNLNDLQHLLSTYCLINDAEIQIKAKRYLNLVTHWKKATFLKDVQLHNGMVQISQVFRKHPFYRLWYQWFQSLFQFNHLSFDVQQKLGLKDTFYLYEMWCFIQIIKVLRELDLIEDYNGLFTRKDEFYFLSLAENKESIVKLKNGGKLVYQRTIQWNTSPFYSYTHRMIPDISIEFHDSMYVLDPKYRVTSSIPIALGEMHKYRDGILHKEDDSRVVKEVYILTPTEDTSNSSKNFYDVENHKRYQMGAFCFSPGTNNLVFREWIKEVFNR